MPGRDLNLLSLDGGGVRGLSSLYILQRIMNAIDPDDPPKPCDYFDVIGGTSTGGLIAIMLGRLDMSVDECINAYTELSEKVFQKKHRIPAQISKYQPERAHHKIKLLKVFNTTQWIIKDFESFMSSIARPQTQQQPNQNCLWVSGIIGCGKTFLANTIIQILLDNHDKQSSRGFVAHVYFDSEKRDSLKATDLFRSYVKQFLRHLYTRQQKPPRDVVLALRRMFGSRVSNPSCSEVLRELLLPLISEVAGTVLVVDGLDLCARDEYLGALACFASILELTSAKVVICGRDELDIKSQLPGSTRLEVSAARNQDDIAVYVKHHVEKRSIYDGPISNNSNTVTQIIETLINKANGMFLWARLQIDVLWDTCKTDAEIVVALRRLPKGLDKTYEKCLDRLRRKQEPYALRVLRYVYEAKNPLTVDALGEALATDPISGEMRSNQIPPYRFIVECGANLIVFDEVERLVVPAHHSVRSFLDGSQAKVLKDLRFRIWDDAEVKLGEMCIAHLCWHMNLAIEEGNNTSRQIEVTTIRMPSIPRMSRWAPPYNVISYMKRPSLICEKKHTTSARAQDKPVLITTIVPMPKQSIIIGSFQQYAASNWLTLSDPSSHPSMLWNQFWKLVPKQPKGHQIGPWVNSSARIAKIADIIWWAIDNMHDQLFALGMNQLSVLDSIDRPDFYSALPDYEGLLPLHLAAKRGSLVILERILKLYKTDPVDPTTGWNALQYAADQGHADNISFILQAFPLSKYSGGDGYSPLGLAIRAASFSTIKAIEAACGDSIWASNRPGDLLHMLVANGYSPEIGNYTLDKVRSFNMCSSPASRLLLVAWVIRNDLAIAVSSVDKAGVSLDTEISAANIDGTSDWHDDSDEETFAAIFFTLEASGPTLATAFVLNGANCQVTCDLSRGRRTRGRNLVTISLIDMTLSRRWTRLAELILDGQHELQVFKELDIGILAASTLIQWLSIRFLDATIMHIGCDTHLPCPFIENPHSF
ncbi:hypothetical protein VTO58DRAFT_103014 [Aureobasidium pullulans]